MGTRKDYIFTNDEADRLHEYSKFLGPTLYVMRLREHDAAFNVACHRAERCAWWSRERGTVVAVPGLNPEERLTCL